jgi:AcrR family transcriptional regulator
MGRVAGLTADETRQRVIDAAAGVFAEKGFEGARVADIAKAAGLSAGAMYNHYESKAELLAAVIECHAGEQLAGLFSSGDIASVLDLILVKGKQLDRGSIEAPLLVEAITAARRDKETLRVLTTQVRDREKLLAEFIRLAQSAGEVDEDADAAALARFCLMLMLGSLLVRAANLPSVNRDAWSALITRLVDGFRP